MPRKKKVQEEQVFVTGMTVGDVKEPPKGKISTFPKEPEQVTINLDTKDKDEVWYMVVYLKHKEKQTIHLYPCDTKEEAKEKEAKLRKTKWGKEIETVRFIKRNLKNYEHNGGYIL